MTYRGSVILEEVFEKSFGVCVVSFVLFKQRGQRAFLESHAHVYDVSVPQPLIDRSLVSGILDDFVVVRSLLFQLTTEFEKPLFGIDFI